MSEETTAGGHGHRDPTPTATLRFVVGEQDTAAALGSGSLPVLATPRLLAWCEATTCAAIATTLAPGQTSLGTRIGLEHLGASLVGQHVEVTASVVHVDGRLRRFTVGAHHVTTAPGGPDRVGKQVGAGEVTRVVVDEQRFLDRLR